MLLERVCRAEIATDLLNFRMALRGGVLAMPSENSGVSCEIGAERVFRATIHADLLNFRKGARKLRERGGPNRQNCSSEQGSCTWLES
jgi:hypothetical protein